jgi:hypothetical protein
VDQLDNSTEAANQAAAPEPDARAEFLRMTANDAWAAWPPELNEDPGERGRACLRVLEPQRERAIALLSTEAAVKLDDAQYRRLIGTARPPGGGAPYLLRAFSASNSIARLTWAGDAVVVHMDAVGPLANVRRHPCVSILTRAPVQVFTVAGYDS